MPPLNELVLVDTNVFLAKHLSMDVIYQQIDSKNFFESAKVCHYCIGAHEMTLAEIRQKYPFVEVEYAAFISELHSQKKFCRIDGKITEEEVMETKSEAQIMGFEISKKDSFIAILAKKKNLCLVSFDQNLIDYCREKGWKAEYPQNLINLEP